jgi:hypothetical protein
MVSIFGISIPNPVKIAEDGAHLVASGANDFAGAMKDAAKAVENMSPSEIGHTVLNVAGMIPVIGAPADAINAGWYAAQGDWGNAALSAATAIPGVGDFVGGARLGATALKLGENGIKAERLIKDGTEAASAAKNAEKALSAGKAATVTGDAGKAATDAGKVAKGVEDAGTAVAKDAKAEEKATSTVNGGPAVATKISELGPKGEAAYNKIEEAINRATGRSPAEVRASLSPDQIRAGQEEGPYLQRMFYGSSVENAVANDPAVLADGNISHLGTSMPGQKVPDFTISADGKTFNMDITGPSESSLNSHLARPYITDPSQVLTYPSPSLQFLKDVFK